MLVLASASPRRQEILRNAGIPFIVQVADIDETPFRGEPAQACAERLAREKATAVARGRPGEVVLGADTVVAIDGEILGKPRDPNDAARMLRLLSGREHQVITGVCLVGRQAPQELKPGLRDRPGGTAEAVPFPWGEENILADVRSETTLVVMDGLTEDDIRGYIATGEPMDKAGAYAIQGIASRWISRIEGDYFNVVGLPVGLVWRMLGEDALSSGK